MESQPTAPSAGPRPPSPATQSCWGPTEPSPQSSSRGGGRRDRTYNLVLHVRLRRPQGRGQDRHRLHPGIGRRTAQPGFHGHQQDLGAGDRLCPRDMVRDSRALVVPHQLCHPPFLLSSFLGDILQSGIQTGAELGDRFLWPGIRRAVVQVRLTRTSFINRFPLIPSMDIGQNIHVDGSVTATGKLRGGGGKPSPRAMRYF